MQKVYEMRYSGKRYRIFTLIPEQECPGLFSIRTGYSSNENQMDVGKFIKQYGLVGAGGLSLVGGLGGERWYQHQTKEQSRLRLRKWRASADRAGLNERRIWNAR